MQMEAAMETALIHIASHYINSMQALKDERDDALAKLGKMDKGSIEEKLREKIEKEIRKELKAELKDNQQRIVPNQRKVLQPRKPNQRKALKLPRLRQNPNQRNLLLGDYSVRKHQPRSMRGSQGVKQIGSWKMPLTQFMIRMELVRS